MEQILYTIIFSAIVGIVMSAPMGPIGMLVVQRTLSKGRLSGLYTGIGAAFSDLLYCLATGFGISFVVDFIENNQAVLRLVGSAVLVLFGVFLLKKNPTRSLNKTQEVKNETPWGDLVTGFLLTFSNPLILIITIGLFAQFNLIQHNFQWGHYIILYLSIIGGALLWWWMVTFFVSKLRSRINIRSLWIVNRVLGSILILLAAYGLYSGLAALCGL